MSVKFKEFERKTECGVNLSEDELCFLGISKISNSLKASYWVGVNCSLNGDQTIRVLPKYEQFDPVGILLDGLPHLGHRDDFHPNNLFKLDVRSGKRVSMPEKLRSTWSLFLIIVFVEELKKLLDRRPKRDYSWQVRNQIGVIRGRIRMQDHIRLNLSRGLPHRICTECWKFDQQSALNQILKEACIHAQQAWSHLCEEAVKKIKHPQDSLKTDQPINVIGIKLRACTDMLADIERPKILTPTLIAQAQRGLKGHFSAYRPVLDWAVSIIRNEYCKMKVEDETSYKMVPFALNMNALFELHVRTAILKCDGVTRNETLDLKQRVFTSTVNSANLKGGPYAEREPDLIINYGNKRVLVEFKYQLFKDNGNGKGKDKDWLSKFQDDEKDKKGKDNNSWKDDPHFEIPRHGFFQTLAYMQLFGCDAGMVIFPSTDKSSDLSGDIGVEEAKCSFSFVAIGKNKIPTTTGSTKDTLNEIIDLQIK